MSLSESSPESDYSLPEQSNSESASADSAFHNQVKNILFDVDVPENLKDSILGSLHQNNISPLVKADKRLPGSRPFLKKPGVLTGLSTCLLFSMLLTYFWVAQLPVIPLSEFSPELNLDSRFLSEFDKNFSEQFPVKGEWSNKSGVIFTSKSYGVSISQSSSHDAVVRFFTLPTGGGKLIYGALVQVPIDRVEPVPVHTNFNPGTVAYTQLKKGNYATVKWVEDDRVYICIVFGGARELEAVGRALESASA